MVKNTFRVPSKVINWHDVLFEKMWEVVEWPGECRKMAMAAAWNLLLSWISFRLEHLLIFKCND